jgi:hypothetical protein
MPTEDLLPSQLILKGCLPSFLGMHYYTEKLHTLQHLGVFFISLRTNTFPLELRFELRALRLLGLYHLNHAFTSIFALVFR